MNRRAFILSTATAAGAVLPASSSLLSAQTPAGRKRALMKLGCQSGPTSDQRLQFFSRHSVKNIDGIPDESKESGCPSVDELLRLKEKAAKWDISVYMITPPFLASNHLHRTERPAI